MINYYIDYYGDSHIQITEIKGLEEKGYLLMVRNFMKSFSKTKPKKQKESDYERNGHPEIKTYLLYKISTIFY